MRSRPAPWVLRAPGAHVRVRVARITSPSASSAVWPGPRRSDREVGVAVVGAGASRRRRPACHVGVEAPGPGASLAGVVRDGQARLVVYDQPAVAVAPGLTRRPAAAPFRFPLSVDAPASITNPAHRRNFYWHLLLALMRCVFLLAVSCVPPAASLHAAAFPLSERVLAKARSRPDQATG